MSALGVLVEDESDYKAIVVLLRRLIPKSVRIERCVTPHGGCSKLIRKAPSYMKELQSKGCTAVILVHDLDRNPDNGELNDKDKLRTKLQTVAVPPGLERHVCIPIEELDAWFWADQNVLDMVGRGLARASASPHLIAKPKVRLRNLSAKARPNRKAIHSTNDNAKLAEVLDLDLCARRCPSFCALRDFAIRWFGTSA